MKTRFFFVLTIGLALGTVGLTAEQGAASGTETGATAAVSTTPPASQTSTNAEPTEAEMREALQRHLDNLNAQMRPPPAPSTSTSSAHPYVYSPYWRYYGGYGYGYGYRGNSKESNYENWTDVARRAGATARVQITSFKKIRCKADPDQGGFLGTYVAELELRGNNPAAGDIMQTSGKRLEAFFYRGDKGWICGEAKGDTK
jgi:hypothetical protein